MISLVTPVLTYYSWERVLRSCLRITVIHVYVTHLFYECTAVSRVHTVCGLSLCVHNFQSRTHVVEPRVSFLFTYVRNRECRTGINISEIKLHVNVCCLYSLLSQCIYYYNVTPTYTNGVYNLYSHTHVVFISIIFTPNISLRMIMCICSRHNMPI